MAEAVLDDRSQQKFYCHLCNVQFQNVSTNFTCPHCSKGFIEELETATDTTDDVDITDSDEEPYQMLNYGPVDFYHISSDDQVSGRSTYTIDPSRQRRLTALQYTPRGRPRTLTRIASTNLRQHTPFETLIQEFIVNLGVGVNWTGGGNMQLFFSNPGDYAWGREGLDAIVTQLLNQMDTSGPPPLSKENIDSIPVVEITADQVRSKLQCSICWDDFVSNEPVRQLPCLHVYHEPCIRPWLELHGTCPICRQNLQNDSQADSNTNSTSNAGNTLDTLQQLIEAVQNSSNISSNRSSNSSTSTGLDTSSSSSSNNSDSIS